MAVDRKVLLESAGVVGCREFDWLFGIKREKCRERTCNLFAVWELREVFWNEIRENETNMDVLSSFCMQILSPTRCEKQTLIGLTLR